MLRRPLRSRIGCFAIPNLREYVSENRGELLTALLTIATGWYAAGKPKAVVPIVGSFEKWCETIGSILAYAGIEGFLSDLADVQEADIEGTQWEMFLRAVYTVTEAKEFTCRELFDKLMDAAHLGLRDLLPDGLAMERTTHCHSVLVTS